MGFVAPDVGFDLGTCNMMVSIRGRGVVLSEPTLVVAEKSTGDLLALGNDAVMLLGRMTEDVAIIRPLSSGIITDFEMTQALLKYMLKKAIGSSYIVKPRIFVSYPCSLSELEQRALREAALTCGARKVYLIEQSILAALGSGLPIFEPNGCMVVDIGGGTTDAAVISLGGTVVHHSIPVGGNKMDEAIISYIRRVFNMLVGDRTAEQIKLDLGTALPSGVLRKARIRGRELTTTLHQIKEINNDQVYEAIRDTCAAIRDSIVQVLNYTPPELCADVKHNGIYLTGGAAQLYGLNQMIATDLKIPVSLAREPADCTAQGLVYIIEHFDEMERRGMLESLM